MQLELLQLIVNNNKKEVEEMVILRLTKPTTYQKFLPVFLPQCEIVCSSKDHYKQKYNLSSSTFLMKIVIKTFKPMKW